MKKYKVMFDLMIDPSKNDKCTQHIYEVEAENEKEAYAKADIAHSNDIPEIRHRSIFAQDIEEI